MTGRELFRRLSPVIKLGNFVFALLPGPVVRALWPLFRSLPWGAGILIRYFFAKRLFKSCGDNVMLAQGVVVKYWENITIGSNVTIHEWCFLDGIGGIDIGDNVSIAHGSSLVSFEHTFADADVPIKYNPLRHEAVSVASDVWIGAGVRILAGSQLAQRSVLAAGAVFKERQARSGLYAGVPARYVKDL